MRALDHDSQSFNRELVARATLRPNGSMRLFWGGCDCGTIRAMEKLEPYTVAERLALRCTGFSGEIEHGIPFIRAIILKKKFRCDRGHMHHAERACFRCPFGPEPVSILTHGWGRDDCGFRVPHCRGPLRPEGDYRILAEDPGLPRRMIFPTLGKNLKWLCPDHRSLSGAGNDVPARS